MFISTFCAALPVTPLLQYVIVGRLGSNFLASERNLARGILIALSTLDASYCFVARVFHCHKTVCLCNA